MIHFLSTRTPKSSSAFQPVRPQRALVQGVVPSPGTGFGVSPCWTSWGASQLSSPACPSDYEMTSSVTSSVCLVSFVWGFLGRTLDISLLFTFVVRCVLITWKLESGTGVGSWWYCMFIQGFTAFRIHVANVGKSAWQDTGKYCYTLLLGKNMTCKDIKTWFYKSDADSLEVAGKRNTKGNEALSSFPSLVWLVRCALHVPSLGRFCTNFPSLMSHLP